MAVIRSASLAGQAAASAHVAAHAIAAANYALQAIHRAADAQHADSAVARERDWQFQRLLTLNQGGSKE